MRILIVELWGLGDAVISTAALRGLAAEGHEIALLSKSASRMLVRSTLPSITYFTLDAPWTAFKGKYHLWRWNWKALYKVIRDIRAWKPDAAVSVRVDPRDHVLMKLSGAPIRIGFFWRFSRALLTHPMVRRSPRQHRVDDWRQLGEAFEGGHSETWAPRLDVEREKATALTFGGDPYIAIHFGARIAVRRWPEPYWRELVMALKREFSVRIVGITDGDGFGRSLAPVCDEIVENLSLEQLTALLSSAVLVIGNDSGPGHIAAATGVPVVTINGPGNSDAFRPWTEFSLVVERGCDYRPCFDYCRYKEPYCLTRLTFESIWPVIRKFVQDRMVSSGREAGF